MKKYLFIVCVIAVLGMAGCATAKEEEEKLDEKIAAEEPTQERAEIANRGAQSFADMPGITEDQRMKLLQINLETADQAQLIQTQIVQTKSVLFQTLASPNYQKSEVSILKNKLVKLDRQRLDLMFNSLDRVEKVLGRSTTDKENIYKEFYLRESRRF